MKEERLKILSLLEDGKIDANQAGELLEVLSKTEQPERCHGHWHTRYNHEETSAQMEEKLQKFAKSAESFAKEFGQKASDVYKDMEPKLKQASQTVLEKTANVLDEIARTLHENIENAKNEKASDDDNTPKPN